MSEFGRPTFCDGEEIQGPLLLFPICDGTASVNSPNPAVSLCRIAKMRKFQPKIGNYYLLVRLCRGQIDLRVRPYGCGQSRRPGFGDAQTPTVSEYGRAVRRYSESLILPILLVLRGISANQD